MRANDVIYMEEANSDPGRATHSVNDTDTPDSASRSGVFLFRPAAQAWGRVAGHDWPLDADGKSYSGAEETLRLGNNFEIYQ
jgi:hypothetical protein